MFMELKNILPLDIVLKSIRHISDDGGRYDLAFYGRAMDSTGCTYNIGKKRKSVAVTVKALSTMGMFSRFPIVLENYRACLSAIPCTRIK